MEENRETVYHYGDSRIKLGEGGKRRSAEKKPGRKKPVLIFLIIIVCFAAVGVLMKFSGITDFRSEDDYSGAAGIGEEHIGILYIEGVIGQEDASYNQEYILDAIEGMKENSENKGMLLYVNTPGGGVYESDEVYLKIREYQDETNRPVYSYMASQATSGGYYISAPADKIIANRNCWTGSIGVTMGTFFDISELLEKYGIKAENIISGDNKAMGSMTEPLTKEQKEILQSLADDSYEQFLTIVAEGRSMGIDEVRKLADGRIYTAKQAQNLGLVDDIALTFEDAQEQMKEECGLRSCELYEFRYEEEPGLFEELIESAVELADIKAAGKGDIGALTELMEKKNDMPLRYMCDVVK